MCKSYVSSHEVNHTKLCVDWVRNSNRCIHIVDLRRHYEFSGHYPDDCVTLAAQLDRFANYVGIAAKRVLPESVGEDDHGIPPEAVFLIGYHSTDLSLGA